MTRKQTRLTIILASLAIASCAVALVLFAVRDTIVFFYTPSEIASKNLAVNTRYRMGGLVELGSLQKDSATSTASFIITDNIASVKVTYKGLLPDLFREGQGVIAEGALNADKVFIADQVLAKHDEKYMPKEVADRLKEKGVWKQDKSATP